MKIDENRLAREMVPRDEIRQGGTRPRRSPLQRGVADYNRGDLGAAETVFTGILETDPNCHTALYMLGLIAYRRGNVQRAIDFLETALAVAPNFAGARHILGRALEDLGKPDAAEACYRRALDIDPNLVAALNGLGRLAHMQGRPTAAAAAFERALEIDPRYLEALNNLGTVRHAQGNLEDAAACYRKALKIDRNDADIHFNLGNVRKSQGYLEDAVDHFRRALALRPDFVDALNNLGIALLDLGKPREAMARFQEALAADADNVAAHRNLGITHARLGNFEAAEAAYDNVISLQPDCADIHYARSLVHTFSVADPDLDALRRLSEQDRPNDLDRARLLFARGEACDQVGLFDEAFRCFERANRIVRAARPFDARPLWDRVAGLRAAYAPQRDSRPAPRGAPTPIFVVGMSRAGKTLVESLLGRADRVFRAGESRTWLHTVATTREQIGDFRDRPEVPIGVSDGVAGAIATAYLRRMALIAPDARYTVNTLPAHLWSVGLILRSIPDARIVYCRRDPMDCCLQIYKRWYETGQSHASDLGNVAAYYKIYATMMDFWLGRYGDRILQLSYEQLIGDPTETARRLFDYCGIDGGHGLAPADLRGDEIDRWRYYEAYLTPLREALAAPAPAI